MSTLKSLLELSTSEAHAIATLHFGHTLPPLDAVENEDWGRDMVLQALASHSDEELSEVGLTRDE